MNLEERNVLVNCMHIYALKTLKKRVRLYLIFILGYRWREYILVAQFFRNDAIPSKSS